MEMIHLNIRKILKRAYNMESAKKIRVKDKLRLEALAIARYMLRKKLFTKAFFEFNGIIALGQFINLGLALLGATSSIHSLLNEIEGLNYSNCKTNASKKTGTEITGHDDDDLGVEVEVATVETPKVRDLEEDNGIPQFKLDLKERREKKRTAEGREKRPKAEKDDMASIFGATGSKKKKKKKKKSAMDDIFG